MSLNPFCPATYKPHDPDITFCTKCGGKSENEIPQERSKAVLQPIPAIDLTENTPPARTKSGRRSCSAKPRSRSAMDHLHIANYRIHLSDRIFNTDVAASAMSMRPRAGPVSLTYKVNMTLKS